MHTDLNGFTKIPKETYPRKKKAPPYKSATNPSLMRLFNFATQLKRLNYRNARCK